MASTLDPDGMIEIPGLAPGMTSRRRFLQGSAYGALAAALNLSLVKAAESGAASPIRSCILLMLYGGPSHLDTWDMKLDALSEVRSQYQPISTNVPGRFVCEHLSGCARVMDRLAVIRSMHHGMNNHNSAVYNALVGRAPSRDLDILGANRTSDFPNVGAALAHLTAAGALPPTANPLTNVALPHVLHNVVDLGGQNAGFLGGGFDPLQIESDPSKPGFQVQNLRPPQGVATARMKLRQGLLGSLDQGLNANVEAASLDQQRNRAFELMKSEAVQNAFRIEREPDRTRDRYGRHKLGQSLLLARRLVEGGVRFVNVHDGVRNGQDQNWDSHARIFSRHQELLAPMDQGFSALIEDLTERGLLDSTLVIAMGEFGRTPKINKGGGRDHWPACYSVVLAGGGVAQGGAVFGSSDRLGAYPESRPVTPGDLAATVFWRFGLNPRHEIRDGLGRPFPLADGEPIRDLFPGAV